MSYERLQPSFGIDKDNIEALKRLVPEAFADGQINWETLKQALSEHLEDEGPDAEHFGLFWPGKREARRMAAIPSKGTLVPAPGEGIDEESTRNIFIEGENLEVLKLLQKSYAGRIKMIYIDPPYNTGNDFVYEDDFKEPLEEYLRRTGQVDEEGKPLTTNTRADGRFHSKWLSMMHPRLKNAQNLLRDDGVIFISIDDNEVNNLRLIMNEIFGEENFIAQIIVQTNPKGRVLDMHFSKTHDYLLVYCKNSLESELSLTKTAEEIAEEYKEKDENGLYRLLELRNTHRQFGKHNRPNLWYPLYVDVSTARVSVDPMPKSVEILPRWEDGFDGCWTWGMERSREYIRLLVAKKVEGKWKIYRKSYAHTDDGEAAKKKLKTIWMDKSMTTENGQKDFDSLMMARVFQSPKPVQLLTTVLQLATSSDEIVLDYFSGSGTTAHAVLELNKSDNGNRRYILVQIPEQCGEDSEAYKAEYKTIAEICKERIRRASRKLKQEGATGDLGFKVFKLTKSHYKAWQDFDGTNLEELQQQLYLAETPLVDGWKEENLLTEILLIEGFSLDSKIAGSPQFKKNKVYQVSSGFCEHRLHVCLETKIAAETIDNLSLAENDIFVCLDSALTDQAKMRLADICKLKTI